MISIFPSVPFLKVLGFTACLGVLSATAKAEITFSNLNLTATHFSVDVSGVMPATPPPTNPVVLYMVNPDPFSDPGFALGDLKGANSMDFTGVPGLSYIKTGNQDYGDYFFVQFDEDLSVGQSLNGTISGTWNSTAFDPSQVSNLNFYWGSNEDLDTGPAVVTGGTFLGKVPVNAAPVPEASSLLMLGLTGLLALRRRR